MLWCQCTICLNTVKITEQKIGNLWNYYRDEPNSSVSNGTDNSIMGSQSFNYKVNFIDSGLMQNNFK